MILTNIILMMAMLSQATSPLYDFKVNDIYGAPLNLADFAGKKILIVNTASRCGYTPQYEELQKLSEDYADRLVVIGFPSNDFGEQEPGSNQEILEFCTSEFQVGFPLTSKIVVKGTEADPLFIWLTNQDNPDFTGDIKWNFEKFLIDENGKLIRRYRSAVSPLDDAIINELK